MRASVGTLVLALVGVSGCDKLRDRFTKKHVAVDTLQELGYPRCDGQV
ncbi:MAG: hypothetical protein JWN48_1318, partial [Myxococcaceae bacterium]|nr:hypothetical protein [Myxococcaceae bacterium]